MNRISRPPGSYRNTLIAARVPTMELRMSIGATRYLSSPSGSVVRIGTINPASFPSFLLVDTEGIGKYSTSAFAGATHTRAIPVSTHHRRTTRLCKIVIRTGLNDVTGL